MKPIVKTRIDNSVYEQLLNNIKEGVWKSGEKLPSESELCAILQVSRVSIRSALQRLQALGFIEVKRAKGSFVRGADEFFDFTSFNGDIELSRQEFLEISALREMTESASVHIIVAGRGTADLTAFCDAYKGMVQAVANLDVDEFTRHDHRFHTALILATGNKKFAQIAQIFREDFYRFLSESNKFILRDKDDVEKMRSHFEESLVYHTELHDALVQGLEEAVEIQKNHLERNIQRFDYYYKDQDDKNRGKLSARRKAAQ